MKYRWDVNKLVTDDLNVENTQGLSSVEVLCVTCISYQCPYLLSIPGCKIWRTINLNLPSFEYGTAAYHRRTYRPNRSCSHGYIGSVWTFVGQREFARTMLHYRGIIKTFLSVTYDTVNADRTAKSSNGKVPVRLWRFERGVPCATSKFGLFMTS
jgi:hypothetical protein